MFDEGRWRMDGTMSTREDVHVPYRSGGEEPTIMCDPGTELNFFEVVVETCSWLIVLRLSQMCKESDMVL